MSYQVEPGANQSPRARMISRRIEFQPLATTTPAKPQRIGRAIPQDNSAMTVWDEAGNEVFGDVDFALESGRDRHYFKLLANSDESPFVG